MTLSSQITRRLRTPFAVIMTAALVGMGGGVAFADDTVPTSPTSTASTSASADASTPQPDATANADVKATADSNPTTKATADKPVTDAKAKSEATKAAPTKPPVTKSTATTAPKVKTPASSGYTNSKVFVCKYVGKPGVDERLQTGNNPISVSVNAINGYSGVGSYFNDAQGRSYVLAVDHGQPEPDVSQCPAPDSPPAVLKDAVATVTPVAPTCSADGSAVLGDVKNATLVGKLDTSVGAHQATFNATDGHAFADGSTTHTVSYTVDPKLTGEQCQTAPFTVLEPKVDCVAKTITFHVDVPAGTTDEVDLDFLIYKDGVQVFGGFWGSDKSGDIVIPLANLTSSTDGSYTYKVINDNTGAEVKTGSFTLSCSVPVVKKVTAVNGVFNDVCGPDFNLTFTPAVTEGVRYVETRTGNTVTVKAEALKGYELTNPTWSQTATDSLKACQPTEVAWPQGSVTLTCKGGSVVLDNSKSTVEVGYSVVVVYKDGSTEFYDFVLKGGEVRSLPLPVLPGGTKVLVQGLDTDLDSATAPSNCVVPPKPPVTNQCPNGTKPGDVNKDGKKDAKDCTKSVVKPNKPTTKPTVKTNKPIVNAGIEAPASASAAHGGFAFNTTAAGIMAAMVLLAAAVVEVLRRRRTAPVNNR